MKKLFLTLIAGTLVGSVCGCASVMRDSQQVIPVKANVEKVDIEIANKSGEVVFKGTIPTTISLDAAAKSGYFNPEKYTVTASKDGFRTQTAVIDWHVSGWYWAGNLVFGGLLGLLIIDPLTGDMYYLDEEVNLTMQPEQ